MNSATLKLACDLIARPSITPEDAGCQDVLIERLRAIGFECETLIFDDVTNLWARRGNAGRYWLLPAIPMLFLRVHWSNGTAIRFSPRFATACFTDVVLQT
jgi:acetylornithine deacetylase/succinyl-diaminopimelate desuccinylase-like protein